MTLDEVNEILKVRQLVAQSNGNTTELQLIIELLKITSDYKKLLESQNNKG